MDNKAAETERVPTYIYSAKMPEGKVVDMLPGEDPPVGWYFSPADIPAKKGAKPEGETE
jgi:hypothetical protein